MITTSHSIRHSHCLTQTGRTPKDFPKVTKYNTVVTFHLMIILDDRDNNGFWVPYKCHSVWGHFECPVNPSCSWQSHDVQVDLLVRILGKLTLSIFNYTIKGKIQLQASERWSEDRQRVSAVLPQTRRSPCPPHGGGHGRGQVGDAEAHEVHQGQVLHGQEVQL